MTDLLSAVLVETEHSTFTESKELCSFKLLIFLWQVMIMQEGSTSLFGSHLKLATLPNSSDTKKSKGFNASKVSVSALYLVSL